MNLIQNDKPILMVREVEFGMYHFGSVLFRFQIKIECVKSFADLKRKGGFSNLTWTKQGNCREMSKGGKKLVVKGSGDHLLNYGKSFHDLHG